MLRSAVIKTKPLEDKRFMFVELGSFNLADAGYVERVELRIQQHAWIGHSECLDHDVQQHMLEASEALTTLLDPTQMAIDRTVVSRQITHDQLKRLVTCRAGGVFDGLH